MEDILKALKNLEDPKVLEELLESSKKQIQEYPVLSVGIAAGLGFLLGFAGVNKAVQNIQSIAREKLNTHLDPMGIFMSALNMSMSQSGKNLTSNKERPQA